MIGEILNRHRDGTLEGGIPNPSLGDICQLVSKAAASITPNVQRRAFTNTGLTLPVDGSEDGALSPELKKLFRTRTRSALASWRSCSFFLHGTGVEQTSREQNFRSFVWRCAKLQAGRIQSQTQGIFVVEEARTKVGKKKWRTLSNCEKILVNNFLSYVRRLIKET